MRFVIAGRCNEEIKYDAMFYVKHQCCHGDLVVTAQCGEGVLTARLPGLGAALSVCPTCQCCCLHILPSAGRVPPVFLFSQWLWRAEPGHPIVAGCGSSSLL